jgi:hypothetical protein
MKWAARLSGTLVVMVLAVLTASPSLAQQPEFCWKDSYGRGVGTVPTSCASGQDMRGLLCYDNCPAGMQVAPGTVDCHSVCPAGMRDDGLFCRRAEYGRGAGYAWEFRDGFNSDGMISRCESDGNGKGNCEMWGAIAYPKCRPGYSAVGYCICRPNVPDCTQLGLGGRLDLSCAKKIQISAPKLGICPGGNSDLPGSAQQMDAGLCYRGCDAGYTGVGPVCWKDPPKGWVNCGMGAAKDSTTCAAIVFGQVAAVGQLALTAATLGSSMAGTAGAGGAANAGKLAQLRELYTKLEKAYRDAKAAYPALKAAEQTVEAGLTVKKGYTAINTAVNVATAEDLARVSAQIASIVDASGVSATIGAYTYPKCSKYSGLGAN